MEIPVIYKKLPGTFWAISAYFNPTQSKIFLRNYHIFRNSSKKQGLNLMTVELAFNNSPFELNKEDADILIQVRGNSVMYQKDRLFNIGLKNLPLDCDKVAWIDADIVFNNTNWINDASGLLEKYNLLQLFDYVVWLKKDQDFASASKAREGWGEGKKSKGLAYAYVTSDRRGGRPGFAWAARREILEGLGFYDRDVVGGARFQDALNLDFKSRLNKDYIVSGLNLKKSEKTVLEWAQKMHSKIKNSFYYVNGSILHLYHGPLRNRAWTIKTRIMDSGDFDPYKDIKLNSESCWEWATNKPKFHKDVKNFFIYKNPDSKIALGIYLFFLVYLQAILRRIYSLLKRPFFKS